MTQLIDPETCSFCTDEVEDSSLKTTPDGERICPTCQKELIDRFPDIKFDEDYPNPERY